MTYYNMYMPAISEWLKKHYAYLLLLLVLVLIAYSNSFTAQFVSDDIEAIALNESNLNSPQYLYNHTVTFARNIVFFIANKIGGLNPFIFRLTNIFFHVGSVWMVYVLGYLLFKHKHVPLIAALLFSVHPILTESVAWISGGIYAQAGFFFLLSFALYIFSKGKKSHYYYISLVVFILSLSSSEKTIILPFILVLYEFVFGSLKQNYKKIIPYVITSLVWAILLISSIQSRLDFINTQAPGQETVFYNPFLHIPVVIVRYLAYVFWPSQLSIYHYDFNVPQIQYVIILAVFIMFITCIVYSYKKNKFIFFWLSFFIITLIPTLNPFGLASINAERYVYLGTVGIVFAVSALFNQVLINKKYRTSGIVIICIVILCLLIRTITRNNELNNSESLWKATIRVVPKDPKPYNNLANIYLEQGNYQEAANLLLAAISLQTSYADAYHNLAHVYQKTKNYPQAIEYYKKALNINSKLWQSYQNIGIIYYDLGNYSEAERYMIEALKNSSPNANLYANYGHVLLEQGKKKDAEMAFVNSLQVDPQNSLARKGLELLISK